MYISQDSVSDDASDDANDDVSNDRIDIMLASTSDNISDDQVMT